ncbi:hypothetical protein KSP40_PGU004324 [Platanthera guangdongensis]|uniref:Uncharacterized protein n=1 Tax=Platanthera guangdongensis TaxID=2320717 RepID=A0ABR2MV11_9ASPA
MPAISRQPRGNLLTMNDHHNILTYFVEKILSQSSLRSKLKGLLFFWEIKETLIESSILAGQDLRGYLYIESEDGVDEVILQSGFRKESIAISEKNPSDVEKSANKKRKRSSSKETSVQPENIPAPLNGESKESSVAISSVVLDKHEDDPSSLNTQQQLNEHQHANGNVEKNQKEGSTRAKSMKKEKNSGELSTLFLLRLTLFSVPSIVDIDFAWLQILDRGFLIFHRRRLSDFLLPPIFFPMLHYHYMSPWLPPLAPASYSVGPGLTVPSGHLTASSLGFRFAGPHPVDSIGRIAASSAAPRPAAPDGSVPAAGRRVSDILVAAAHHHPTDLAEAITPAACPSDGAAATHQHRRHCYALPGLVMAGGQGTR